MTEGVTERGVCAACGSIDNNVVTSIVGLGGYSQVAVPEDRVISDGYMLQSILAELCKLNATIDAIAEGFARSPLGRFVKK